MSAFSLNESGLERFAIAYTDEPSRLAYDSGTIWQIVPHMQLQTALSKAAMAWPGRWKFAYPHRVYLARSARGEIRDD
jgi:hypothetical protein